MAIFGTCTEQARVRIMLPLPIQVPLVMLAGWVARHQQQTSDYPVSENATLREQLGGLLRYYCRAA